MTKDAYYFSHDANSRHDPKCLKLIAKFGMEGYGIFWVIVETLREHTDYKMPLADIEAIEMDCKCKAKELIMHCISIGLFETDDVLFWAPSLLRRMEHLDDVREKRRQSALFRWENKVNKEKKSKVKESSLHSKSNANVMQMQVDEIYKLYPAKSSTGRSTSKCHKDKDKINRLIKQGVDVKGIMELYIIKTDPKYYKNLSVFLNNLPDKDELLKASDLKDQAEKKSALDLENKDYSEGMPK